MYNNEEESAGNIIVLIIAMMVLMPLVMLVGLYHAFAILKLYSWFLVPLGAPIIKFWNMYGIMLLINIFTAPKIIPKEKDDKMQFTITMFLPAMTLLIGWIVKSFLI